MKTMEEQGVTNTLLDLQHFEKVEGHAGALGWD
jgi:hypothetical protein